MKNKRLPTLTIALAVVLTVVACMLCACVDKPASEELQGLRLPQMGKNQMTVVVKNGTRDFTCVTVDLDDSVKTVEDALQKLSNQSRLHVQWEQSQYGKFVKAIGKIAPQEANQFISVLTSVADDQGDWAGVTTYTVGDVTLVSAKSGVSALAAQAGSVVYFELATY